MPMTDSASHPTPARVARLLAWVGVPVLSLVSLRLFEPLTLATDPSLASGWVAPAAGAAVAVAGGIAALLAISAALRATGSLARVFDAASAGGLAAAAGMMALQGPSGSHGVPQVVVALGLLAAAIPLLAAELVGPVSLHGQRARVTAIVGVFAWVEIAPLMGVLLEPEMAPAVTALAAVAAAVAAVAAVAAFSTGHVDRLGWVAGVASGAGVLAAARPGTLDVLPGLLALAAALAAAGLWVLAAHPERGDPANGSRSPVAPPPVLPVDDTATEADRLARELRATIAELLAARQTIALQRAELEKISEVDPATRVASRRAILGRLHIEASEARRYAHPISLVLVDLDGLAGLNRTYGIETGDAILAELALRLRVRIREADAVGRLTGDTFLAILPHTDERGATVFADAVRTRLTARPVITNAGPISLSVSIGITIVHPGMDDAGDDQILGRCEEALASARAAGGNRIAFDRQHGLARIDERRAGSTPAEPDEELA